jgi:hypothetical protein
MATEPVFPINSSLGPSSQGGFFTGDFATPDYYDDLFDIIFDNYDDVIMSSVSQAQKRINEKLRTLNPGLEFTVRYDPDAGTILFGYSEWSEEVNEFEYGGPERSASGFLRSTVERELSTIAKDVAKSLEKLQ